MHIKTGSGTVRNADGGSAPFTFTINEASIPFIQSVTVTPETAPAGTERTIKIVATDPDGLALTYECSVEGVPLVPTANPGEFIWHG